MALSVRTRFEVFKRDDFTCRYCGGKSPAVVLQVDHIIAVCNGGTDDPINLVTSCWACNSGKSGVPLAEVMTGEDPHDKAIELLEKRRQLEEYNLVLAEDRSRREETVWELWRYWVRERCGGDPTNMPRRDFTWLMNVLSTCPSTKLLEFMDAAIAARADRDFRYVSGCVRNWREKQDAETSGGDADFQAQFEAYLRGIAIEEVLLNVREAEYERRQRGHCNHEVTCSNVSDCVQTEVRIRLGVPPSNGAPSRNV